MATEKSPAFQFYPGDFLAGSQAALTCEQAGAYIRMLAYSWLMVGLPNDRSQIARMTGASDDAVQAVIDAHFVLRRERFVNPRQEQERVKQRNYREQRRLAGEQSGIARSTSVQRAFNGTPTKRQRKGNSSSSSSVQIQDPSPSEKVSAHADLARFPDFWRAWPAGHRVGGKGKAEGQWHRLSPADRDAAIADVLARVRTDRRWQAPAADGQWAIPHPWRYLRDRRFEDDRPGLLPESRGCGHEPPCRTTAEHTRRYLNDERAKRGEPPMEGA